MQRARQTQTRRAWRAPRTVAGPRDARSGRRAAERAIPFGGARGRPATSRTRFGATVPGRVGGRRAAAGRRKQSGGGPGIAFGRPLSWAFGKQKQSKRSRKGPALLAVIAGLGAAGAAALKRRRSGEDQPTVDAPPTQPAAPTTAAEHARPPAPAAEETAPPPGAS